jgi:AraC-like DNA-binding protein
MGSFTGWCTNYKENLREIETPFGGLPLIVSFGPTLRVSGHRGVGGGNFRSFVAGLQEGWVVTEYAGESAGVQANLTPLGAFQLLFGPPMFELANRTIGLEDLLGPEGRRLGERLGAAATWNERFALLGLTLCERLACAKPPSEPVAWAWQQLQSTGGRVRIGALAETMGCSRKHLVARFREQIGLPPKSVARILRFERAKKLLARSGARPLDVALACGYFDQSHLIRDFRELSGTTPGGRERR